MGKEIERKFLVKSEEWKSLAKGTYYRQGYLSTVKERVVRVRTIDDKGFLTIKGKVEGISRSEFEYEIPVDDANLMLDSLCEKPIIEKYRAKIEYKGAIWEVDEFHGENEGLVVAEVELKDENQVVEIPSWIGEEVSGDPRYFNSNLIKNPFTKW
ncbi:MAG TPA: CYTH domain-containing protein [Ignavibacteriaceae bacterium]|jgi:CYTH domain-containing protein|nr:CYTH domain-containing protein [Ignavibacteriaceae bacterium]